MNIYIPHPEQQWRIMQKGNTDNNVVSESAATIGIRGLRNKFLINLSHNTMRFLFLLPERSMWSSYKFLLLESMSALVVSVDMDGKRVGSLSDERHARCCNWWWWWWRCWFTISRRPAAAAARRDDAESIIMSTNTFYELLLQPHEDPPQTELAIQYWWSVCAAAREKWKQRTEAKVQKSGSWSVGRKDLYLSISYVNT